MQRHLIFAATAIAIVIGSEGRALAIDFDPAGNMTFDKNAIVTEGFESFTPVDGLTITTADATHTALEGTKFASVNTTQSPIAIPLTIPKTDASYRARFFARTNRFRAEVDVDYPSDGGYPSQQVLFYPTGRVTSDGWYEMETSTFSVQSARFTDVTLSLFASGADIDAFELVSDGVYRAPTTCSIARDPICKGNEYCAAGWCQDGEYQVPPLPSQAYRSDIVTYFQQRFQLFFGGVFSRASTLPLAIGALGGMRTATNAWTFWDGFATGLHKLHDWHTTLDGPVAVAGRGAFPICFVEGDADLTHAAAPADPVLADVLVSSVGPDENSGLAPGDRLVAVDGMHPIAWAETLDDLDWGAWHADDPGTHAEAVERMRNLIRRFAKQITLIQCHSTTTCDAPVTIDVSSLPTTEPAIYPTCDHRPAYHLATGNPDATTHDVSGVYYGLLADSDQSGVTPENIYGMIWDDVGFFDTTNPYQAAIEAFRANANGVILDHRTGNGGTADAATYLTTLFRAPAQLATYTGNDLTLGLLDQPFSTELGQSLYNLFVNVPGDGYSVGDANARTTMRTALLLARDGSASDWFPYGMQGSPNIKIFGRQSAGAFSSFLQFDYFEGFAWRLASGDLVRADGTGHLGHAVVPDADAMIIPKQSDLVVGVDTAYAAALQWVRTGTL